jgi:hypothetical protein
MLSVDPVTAYESGDWRHLNRYAYAYNNPYRFTDPDGRRSREQADHAREQAKSRRQPPRTGTRIQARSSSGTRSASTTGAPSAAQPAPAQSGKGQVTSVFSGDAKPTFTYAAALGVGGKAELKEGPNNDRYSITTPALGVTAAGTWNVVTANYDFLPSQNSSPVDVGLNVGGEIGLIGVIGGGLRYTPPAKFEISINAGLGAAARVEIFEVGLTPGKLP